MAKFVHGFVGAAAFLPGWSNLMSIRSAIIAQMRAVAASQGRTLAPLADELVLLECGLDSLCFAILVAQLEDELGFDPFTASEDAYFPVTFGDFVAFYEAGRAPLHAV
jgi:hypothetical protein